MARLPAARDPPILKKEIGLTAGSSKVSRVRAKSTTACPEAPNGPEGANQGNIVAHRFTPFALGAL